MQPDLCSRGRCQLLALASLISLSIATVEGRAAETTAPANVPPADTNQVFAGVNAKTRSSWQQHLTLGPGDVLSISLFGYPDSGRSDVVIGPDGRVSYLQAMNIMANGLSIDELRAKFDQELANFYRTPKTIIVPMAYRSKKFYMLGKVVNKGVFMMDRPTTVLEAVAQAHGFEIVPTVQGLVETADLPRSFLLRQGQRAPIDFQRLFQDGDLSQNLALEPGDYLYFPSTADSAVYVVGYVGSPGPVPIGPQLSVLSAITQRGGFARNAYRSRVLVVRGSLNHPKTIVVDTAAVLAAQVVDFKLEPKDIVYVSQRPFSLATELLEMAARAYLRGVIVTWTGDNMDMFVDPITP